VKDPDEFKKTGAVLQSPLRCKCLYPFFNAIACSAGLRLHPMLSIWNPLQGFGSINL